ncbi:hypothetical protein CONCODRAFT_12919 [Conidiobolus coronatus NRRL 28638]|uniref:Cytokinin riboside 5'-monophosphate phosphoribohydrolase n=1 Tax=Conidiobolus coronatus (strain ATCC 28846 / CBS 209.66 / NRRL 28638) TaxID=796925 RepID=A0A137NS08_CONC2|nr:hypothetical protein CONCODRAFT_12919 [Conidiobolus coronatus NRRL 28638]|eukprot:KXN65472.1 hypothetical protein CONCODRAFT_12919 [Conidiobolus coronatus NRRL 28638]
MTVQYICVFCGSSDGTDPKYLQVAREVGTYLAKHNYGLVYGGGRNGIMGTVAKSVSENGGSVISIILKLCAVNDKDNESKGYGEIIEVPDMHTRKALMHSKSVAFLTLPGGYGTLEELLEMTTWGQLGIHSKPVMVLNILELYTPLKTLIYSMVDNGFIKATHKDLIKFIDEVDQIKGTIDDYEHPEDYLNFKWDLKQ